MAKTPRPPDDDIEAQRALRRVLMLLTDDAPPSRDEADAILRASGLDPDEIGRRAAELARQESDAARAPSLIETLFALYLETPPSREEADALLNAAGYDPAAIGAKAAEIARMASAAAAAAEDGDLGGDDVALRAILEKLFAEKPPAGPPEEPVAEDAVFSAQAGQVSVSRAGSAPRLTAAEAKVVAFGAAKAARDLENARRAGSTPDVARDDPRFEGFASAAHSVFPERRASASSEATRDAAENALSAAPAEAVSVHLGDRFAAIFTARLDRGQYQLDAYVIDDAGAPVQNAEIIWRKRETWNRIRAASGAARITSRRRGDVEVRVEAPERDPLTVRVRFEDAL